MYCSGFVVSSPVMCMSWFTVYMYCCGFGDSTAHLFGAKRAAALHLHGATRGHCFRVSTQLNTAVRLSTFPRYVATLGRITSSSPLFAAHSSMFPRYFATRGRGRTASSYPPFAKHSAMFPRYVVTRGRTASSSSPWCRTFFHVADVCCHAYGLYVAMHMSPRARFVYCHACVPRVCFRACDLCVAMVCMFSCACDARVIYMLPCVWSSFPRACRRACSLYVVKRVVCM